MISVILLYLEFDFIYIISVSFIENGVEIILLLLYLVLVELVGKVGFNMEFLLVNYMEISFLVDGKFGMFLLYFIGVKEIIGQYELVLLVFVK